jgi:hypothetical protein
VREIRSEIEINAPAERVWQVLSEFDRYPAWNPFLRVTGGEAAPGAHLVVTILPEGGPNTTFRATVEVAAPAKELRWIAHLGVPGVFDGRHRFEIEPIGPGRARVVQSETFRGLLVAVAFYFGVGDAAQKGFDRMNAALRVRVESGVAAAPPAG